MLRLWFQKSAAALALLCFSFLLATSQAVLAQSQASSGQIVGIITDSAGAAVPNASVKVTNKDTGLERTVTTSGDGIYTVVLLPPGTYMVAAQSSGFAETKVDEVVVNVGRTADVNISLGAGGVQEVVTVTAEAIQTTRNESDAVLNETAINNLPINGRRFQDFVTLTPTAQVDPQRGQISLSGQRGINANINVDGVDYNQSFFGGIRGGERSNQAFTIPQESIKEFQVVAAGYSAEFGRSSGGIVNAVTKSGTNEIRGSLFYLLRHKELAAKNDFIRDLEADRRITVTPAPTQQQFGGSIGGPAVKDKLFYFFSYEHQIFDASRQVLFPLLNSVTRSAANQEAFDLYRSLETGFTQTNDALAGLGRMDWQINQNHRFSVRYNFSQNKALNANATGESVLDPTTTRALSNNGTERNRNNIGVIQLTSILNPGLVNELRFQYAREDRPRFANSLSPNVDSSIGNFGTRNFLPTTQYDTRTQVADNITVTSGNHTSKFGFEFSHIAANQIFGFNQTGNYFIRGGTNDVLQVLSRTPGSTSDFIFDTLPNARRPDLPGLNAGATYSRQIGNLIADFGVKELAFFGQDSWRIRSNLTLNYGLRVEKQYNPEPEANNQPLIDLVRNGQFPIRGGRGFDPTVIPDSDFQIGPRLGFAWDPFGDGKSVVRAFSGLYYARTPLLLFAGPFNNFRSPAGDLSVRLPFSVPANFVAPACYTALNLPPVATELNPTTGVPVRTTTQPITLYRQLRLLCAVGQDINLNNFSLGNLPNISPEQVQAIARIINPSINPAVSGVAPIAMAEDFKNPTAFQFGFAYERELATGLTVGVDYSQVNTIYLQRNRDINLPVPVIRPNDPELRPFFGVGNNITPRPVASLGSIQLRESTGRSLFQGVNFRVRLNRKWGQLNAFYTLSRSLSDDDNERDAGGTAYDNSFNLGPEYNYSRLDRRHQFVANPVFFLPYGFEVASAIRLRSGLPIDAIANFDLNRDGISNDRPYKLPGLPFERNAFRNRAVYDTDLRVQKGVNFDEARRLILTAEFFNVFNAQNIQYSGTAVTQFCAQNTNDCLTGVPTNPNFLQIFDQSPTSPRRSKYLLNNNLGSQSQVFQVQLGVRFQF